MRSTCRRRAITFILLIVALLGLLVFFHLYCGDPKESFTAYALNSGQCQLAFDHNGKGFLHNKPKPSSRKQCSLHSTSTATITGFDRIGRLLRPTMPTPTSRCEDEEPQETAGKPASSVDPWLIPLTVYPYTASPKSVRMTGAIVAAVSSDTDMTWMSEVRDPMWELHRYNHDDPSPSPITYFPVNKGNEAMMYLSYIINNYDSLPDYSVFIHGHRWSWHQEGDMVAIINDFRLPALDKAGYAPLRCDWYPSCPREIRPIHHDAVVWGPGVHREDTEYEIGRIWSTLFGEDVPLPHTIASQCCAQFAVTRNAIQQRPKAEYERMRQWLVNTDLVSDVSGRVFEKLWAYIFTREAVRCPPPQQCACEFFGRCEAKKWTLPPPGLQKWDDVFDNYVPVTGAVQSTARHNSTHELQRYPPRT